MKKIIAFVAILLAFMLCLPQKNFITIAQEFDGELFIYTTKEIHIKNSQCNKNGVGWIIQCNIKESQSILNSLQQIPIDGFTLSLNNASINEVLYKYNAVTILEEQINDIKFIYAYSAELPKYLTQDSQIFNLQIALKKDVILVGYPALLGSV